MRRPRLLAVLIGCALAAALPCRAEPDLTLAYLRGAHRVVFRVTARGATTSPALPSHCTLTYTQAILAQGMSPEGAYADVEVRAILPSSINTRVPYPGSRTSLPDSVLPYLEGPGTEREQTEVDHLLEGIRATAHPSYQDQMVETIMEWEARHIAYDSLSTVDQNPLAVVQRQSASCAGYAELTIAVLRRAGIPARRMGCVIPPDCGWGTAGLGGRHAFIEVYYSDVGWLASDPQRSFHFVDPFHLLTHIEGRGDWLGDDRLEFKLLEDDCSLELAALFREPELSRNSAIVRGGPPEPCLWVPYTFRHRRLDGSFVHVGVQGDQVITSRDGRREVRWVWGDREIYDSANRYRLEEATTPWYPPQIVRREARNGEFRFFPDGRRQFVHADGATEVRYPDGTREFRSAPADGYQTVTSPDGRMEVRFADGTRQVRAPDGRAQVEFPNGDRKLTEAGGTETYYFANGDKQITYRDGRVFYEWANGARQVRAD